MSVPWYTMTSAVRALVLFVSVALFFGTLLTGAATGPRPQPTSSIDAADAELATALEGRDIQTASRLLKRRVGQALGLPSEHAAATLLGPAAVNDLPAMLAAEGGDEAAAARINNLGVSLALRGWVRSADVCFGRAITRTGTGVGAGATKWPARSSQSRIMAGRGRESCRAQRAESRTSGRRISPSSRQPVGRLDAHSRRQPEGPASGDGRNFSTVCVCRVLGDRARRRREPRIPANCGLQRALSSNHPLLH